MFGLRIFVRVQIFRRVPPVLPRNFCHPASIYSKFLWYCLICSNLALLKRKKHSLQMSHIYRLIIGPHKHVCNAIWANLDWFWRESNCLIVNRSFLCHLTYNLRYQENISVLNLLFLNLSVCYGIWGQFRANPFCYFAHLCYFADLCTSANLIFLKLHFKWQHFPNIWRSRWKAVT